jgi:hypothetical protein
VFRATPRLIPRAAWSALFALLLSMRLMTPHGFMPAWEAGRFQIGICDDAGAQIGKASRHDHHKKDGPKHRQPCPFAAASAQSFVDAAPAAIIEPPEAIGLSHSTPRPVALLPIRKIERPPSRAPPDLT